MRLLIAAMLLVKLGLVCILLHTGKFGAKNTPDLQHGAEFSGP